LEIKIDKIIRSKRRTVALVVMHDASLVIRAPMEYIHKFIDEKRGWIEKKRRYFLEKADKFKKIEFISGEVFYLAGSPFKLEIYEGIKPRIKIVPEDNVLKISTAMLKSPAKYLTAWYKIQAKKIIIERVKRYSEYLNFKYKSVRITSAVSRWGSCGTRNTLNFSWRLVTAPMDVIDCVVVHELVHTEIKNHSAKFYDRLKSIMPDYKEREKWLKENSGIMRF
jgi:predicted metal-dependent hydrolase